jgi:hypothetical protein
MDGAAVVVKSRCGTERQAEEDGLLASIRRQATRRAVQDERTEAQPSPEPVLRLEDLIDQICDHGHAKLLALERHDHQHDPEYKNH